MNHLIAGLNTVTRPLRSRLTFANVTSVVALFVALGGSSYAALKLPKASVGPTQLRDDAVTSSKVKQGSLTLSDFRRSQRAALQGLPGRSGAAGTPGTPGTPGAKGPKGDAGPGGHLGRALYVTKRSHTDLPAAADLTIASLDAIPAGSYLLVGHTAAANFTASAGYVRCGIRSAGKDSFGASNLGSATAVGVSSAFSVVGQVFVSLPVTSSQPFTANLFCRQTGGSMNAYVEETRLIAMPAESIDVRGDA